MRAKVEVVATALNFETVNVASYTYDGGPPAGATVETTVTPDVGTPTIYSDDHFNVLGGHTPGPPTAPPDAWWGIDTPIADVNGLIQVQQSFNGNLTSPSGYQGPWSDRSSGSALIDGTSRNTSLEQWFPTGEFAGGVTFVYDIVESTTTRYVYANGGIPGVLDVEASFPDQIDGGPLVTTSHNIIWTITLWVELERPAWIVGSIGATAT